MLYALNGSLDCSERIMGKRNLTTREEEFIADQKSKMSADYLNI